jgi:hypothetical protein
VQISELGDVMWDWCLANCLNGVHSSDASGTGCGNTSGWDRRLQPGSEGRLTFIVLSLVVRPFISEEVMGSLGDIPLLTIGKAEEGLLSSLNVWDSNLTLSGVGFYEDGSALNELWLSMHVAHVSLGSGDDSLGNSSKVMAVTVKSLLQQGQQDRSV